MDQAKNGNEVKTSDPPDINIPEHDVNDEPGLLYRAVYRVGYCLSFGIMLPTLLIVRAIPLNNAFGDGLCDGALAAKDTSAAAYAGMRRAGNAVAQKASDIYAGMSRKVQERVEGVQDAMAERRHRQQIAASEGATS